MKTTGGSSHDFIAATEPSSSQIRACNAVKDRYGEVEEFSGLKPGAFEIILKYDDGSYVCDVEADGKVTYYEKLR